MAHVMALEADMIRVAVSGALTPQDLTDIMREADEIEKDMDPILSRITVHAPGTEVEVGYKEVKAFAWYRRELRFPNVFRSAIVVNSPVQRGIARMFQTLNDNPQIVIEIFDDEAAALAWLRT
jgi:SpoIIAA-like